MGFKNQLSHLAGTTLYPDDGLVGFYGDEKYNWW